MSAAWSAAAGAIPFFITRDRKISLVIGLAVLSHWIFDFISHSPDLPLLFNNSHLVGLGLES